MSIVGDSGSIGCGFDAHYWVLHGHFFTLVCCKNCNVGLEKNKNKNTTLIMNVFQMLSLLRKPNQPLQDQIVNFYECSSMPESQLKVICNRKPIFSLQKRTLFLSLMLLGKQEHMTGRPWYTLVLDEFALFANLCFIFAKAIKCSCHASYFYSISF